MVERGGSGRTTGRWLAGALLVLVGAGCTPLDDVMAGVFGRSMRDQPSIDPYEEPLAPPENSVPFAAGNFPASRDEVNLGQPSGTAIPAPVTPLQMLTAQNDPDAVPEVTGLENPVPPDEASLARGEEVFDRACTPCHGPAGEGGSTVGEFAVALDVSLLTSSAMELNDSYIYSIIRAGRSAMPSYGHQISHYDRWHVANYVLQIQGRLEGSAEADETGPSDD